MRYLPKRVPVEAFRLGSGNYVVVPEGGEPRIATAEDFESAFEPDPWIHPGDRIFTNAAARALAGATYGRSGMEDELPSLRERNSEMGRALDRLREERPGTPHTAEDEGPAWVKMADAIAARTTPSTVEPPRALPLGSAAAEAAIAATREQVERMGREAKEEGLPLTGGGIPYGTVLKPGEKAGRGRKVCQKCYAVNNVLARTCLNEACGARFPRPK